MKRIDTPNSVSGRFRNGNAVVGQKGTYLDETWFNNLQEEIANTVENAGIALNGNDETQLLQAIEYMIDQTAGAGLSTSDRNTIDASVPLGAPLPPFLELWNVSDWQASASYAGMKMTPIGVNGQYLPVAAGLVPRRYLATGGVIRIFATGTFTAGSTNPTLGAKLYINGQLKRPFGVLGAQGWTFSNGTTGKYTLGMLKPDSRWVLDATLIVIGERAAQHGAITFGTSARIISTGYLEVGDFAKGEGDLPGALTLSGSAAENQSNGGYWLTGTAYTPSSGHIVFHHGAWYRCIAPHTSSSSNEPGGGSILAGTTEFPEWKLYWRLARLRYNLFNPHALDELPDEDLLIELQIGAPTHTDVLSPAAWATSTVYAIDTVVHNGGAERYAARQPPNHTSAADTEPGVGANWQRVWAQLDDHGHDKLWVDFTHAYAVGGTHGYEPRSF